MFKVTKLEHGDYQVSHYANGDPNPTPTQEVVAGAPEAWCRAIGRAGKMAILNGRPQEIEMYDGRRFMVSVTEISNGR